jgi:HSP20 family protein
MNLLRFSRPLGYHAYSDETLNHFLRGLESENCFAIPQANVLESKENFKIELSLAGFSKDQISIQFQDGLLIVKGASDEKPDEDEKYLTREFGLKSFVRRFTLPKTVDTELISATFSNGVLTVTIPKKEEVKEKEPKDIIIN